MLAASRFLSIAATMRRAHSLTGILRGDWRLHPRVEAAQIALLAQ